MSIDDFIASRRIRVTYGVSTTVGYVSERDWWALLEEGKRLHRENHDPGDEDRSER